MSLIVAARFTTFPAAEEAAQNFSMQASAEEDVTLFFVNPRGQHARFSDWRRRAYRTPVRKARRRAPVSA